MKDVAKFHARRATGIGGSDVGAIMGVSPWGTALDVWISKRKGAVPVAPKESEAMNIGRMIEPTIAALFTQRTGRKLRKGRFARHLGVPYMIGHPDAVAVDTRAIVEFKNVGLQRAAQFGDSGTDMVPPDYTLQVLHYMIVTSVREGWLAALIGGNEFRIYRIPWNAELVAMVMEAERVFWQSVVDGKMPHAPRTPDQALALFPIGTPFTREVNEPVYQAWQALRQVKEVAQATEDREGELIAQIMAFMGEAVRLEDIDHTVLATWDNRTSNRLDVAALRAAHPDIAAKFTRATTTRVFLPKGMKGD